MRRNVADPGCRQKGRDWLARGFVRAQYRSPALHQEGDAMPIKHFPPPPGVKAPPLSFAARTGDLLYISGIPGFDEKRELPDTFEAQFRNVVTNIKRVLDEAGGSFRDLVKVNVLLTRASDVAAMNALYAGAFGPAPYPARTTCVVVALPDPKMLIEIEAVASLAR
jgi:2-iminobutanoate/2-iminopropanoate deaminase